MRPLESLGWLLFLVSSVLFLVSGFIAGDPWAISGSGAFLAGVVVIWFTLSRDG